MAYTPGLINGTEVSGITHPPGATGGLGWLSALYNEMRAQRRLLELILVALQSKEEKR